MWLCAVLAISSVLFIGLSLESGWTVTDSSVYAPSIQNNMDYVEYNSLSDVQREFIYMLEGGVIKATPELSNDIIIGVMYEGEEYMVQNTLQKEVGVWSYFIVGVVNLIVGIVGGAYSWKKRSSIRLKKLREDPIAYVEE